MLNMIEDIILHIYDPINGFDRAALAPRDRSILFSIASQLKKPTPLALTQKQADLAIKIIKDNIGLYQKIENLSFLLDNPIFKWPFRVIDTARTISRIDDYIAIRYPFDHQVNKLLDKIPGRKTYDQNYRCHLFALTESNLIAIVDDFSPHGFHVDNELLTWCHEIREILNSPQKYVPSAVLEDDRISLINCSRNVIEFFNSKKKNNVVTDSFLAKTMGIHLTPDLLKRVSEEKIDSLTKSIINTSGNKFSITVGDSAYNKFNIANMLSDANAYPIIISMNDDDTLLTEFRQWMIALNKAKTDNSEIAVLFRSDKNVDFNQTIKNEHLNNLVDEDTKIVFIKHKIPKILYKLDFKPKVIICNSLYYAHFSCQKMVESHPFILYYTDQSITSGRKIAKL